MTSIEPSPDGSAGPSPRAQFIVAALVLLLLAALGALILASRGGDDAAPPDSASVGGGFTLIDTQGRTFTDQALRGKPFAIFFGFTRCPDVCPTTLGRMTQLRKQLGADGMKVNIVFVSVDPGHDTPADIGNYLTLFPSPIIGLTGTDAQIKKMTDDYGVYFSRVPMEGGDYMIDHMAGVMLFDSQGRFVEMLDPTEPPAISLERLRMLIHA